MPSTSCTLRVNSLQADHLNKGEHRGTVSQWWREIFTGGLDSRLSRQRSWENLCFMWFKYIPEKEHGIQKCTLGKGNTSTKHQCLGSMFWLRGCIRFSTWEIDSANLSGCSLVGKMIQWLHQWLHKETLIDIYNYMTNYNKDCIERSPHFFLG